MPLRVFVSHSAKEPDAIAAQNELIARLSADPAKFTPLMDKSELKAGDRWRARINFWIGSCDVAVVLLSPSALNSPYVAYEVSVLSYRESRPNSTFKILPVYLQNVDPKKLQESRLDPAQLTEIQSLANKKTPAEIADAVIAELTKMTEAPERPIDRVIKRARFLLEGVSTTIVDNAARTLTSEKRPWVASGDAIGPLAESLLGVGMLAAMPALIELNAGMSEDKMQQLVDLVACTWVDIKAVESLPRIAQCPIRAVALNAAQTETARMYHLAASSGDNKWIFVPCDGEFAESAEKTIAEQIAERVRAAIASAFRLKQSDNVDRKLDLIKKNYVVLVAIPAEGLMDDPEIARALRKAFPTVTFFFLMGSCVPGAIDQIAERIIPELQADEEKEFHDAYEVLDANVIMPMRARGSR
jgi:hypothetical protein